MVQPIHYNIANLNSLRKLYTNKDKLAAELYLDIREVSKMQQQRLHYFEFSFTKDIDVVTWSTTRPDDIHLYEVDSESKGF